MNISKDQSLLQFHLESIEAGGHEMVVGDDYEMVGDNNAAWDVSISTLCGAALRRIRYLEHQLDKHSMDAGQADQRRAESRAVRKALGFGSDADNVSPHCLLDALDRRDATMREQGALAVRHLTQGDDWEDDELRAVIDDYVAGLRCQAEADQ